MKLIEYDKHRMKIQKKVRELMFDPKLTCRETEEKIMEFLDNLPADYTEEQITGIDQAYQRVCRELDAVQRGAKEQRAVAYSAFHKMITGRIVEIQSLLLQYPEAAAGMSGRLDELNMMLAECERMAAAETKCKKRIFEENMQVREEE